MTRRTAQGSMPNAQCGTSLRYLSRIVGIRYWSNAPRKAYRGAKPQSRRAAASFTSAGHESTIAWRFRSISHVIRALGNASTTTSQISRAVGLKAVTLYAVRDSFSRGVDASLISASIASGMAMNGMRVSGLTKHAYGSPRAAAWIISGAKSDAPPAGTLSPQTQRGT